MAGKLKKVKLTKEAIHALPFAEGKQYTVRDEKLPGFGVRVGSTVKTYVVEAKPRGQTKPVRVTLGRTDLWSVEAARAKAKEFLATLAQGENPNVKKQDQKVYETSLRQILLEFLQTRPLKPRSIHDYELIFYKESFADWLDRPLVDITRDDVENRFRELSKKSRARANLSMRLLRAIFNYSLELMDSQGNPIIIDNPVLRLTRKRMWHRINHRTRFLPAEGIAPWWQAVHNLPDHNDVMKDYFLLALLTGLRRENLQELRWDYVNLQSGVLTIPAEEMKDSRKPFELPLGPFAWKLLKDRADRRTGSPYVFPGTGRTGHLTEPKRGIQSIHKATGLYAASHDLRRSFISYAHEIKIDPIDLKRLLSHAISNVTEAYVQTPIENRRKPMRDIEAFILDRAHITESVDE